MSVGTPLKFPLVVQSWKHGWIYIRSEYDALRGRQLFRIDREDGRSHFFSIDYMDHKTNHLEMDIISQLDKADRPLPLHRDA